MRIFLLLFCVFFSLLQQAKADAYEEELEYELHAIIQGLISKDVAPLYTKLRPDFVATFSDMLTLIGPSAVVDELNYIAKNDEGTATYILQDLKVESVETHGSTRTSRGYVNIERHHIGGGRALIKFNFNLLLISGAQGWEPLSIDIKFPLRPEHPVRGFLLSPEQQSGALQLLAGLLIGLILVPLWQTIRRELARV